MVTELLPYSGLILRGEIEVFADFALSWKFSLICTERIIQRHRHSKAALPQGNITNNGKIIPTSQCHSSIRQSHNILEAKPHAH